MVTFLSLHWFAVASDSSQTDRRLGEFYRQAGKSLSRFRVRVVCGVSCVRGCARFQCREVFRIWCPATAAPAPLPHWSPAGVWFIVLCVLLILFIFHFFILLFFFMLVFFFRCNAVSSRSFRFVLHCPKILISHVARFVGTDVVYIVDSGATQEAATVQSGL